MKNCDKIDQVSSTKSSNIFGSKLYINKLPLFCLPPSIIPLEIVCYRPHLILFYIFKSNHQIDMDGAQLKPLVSSIFTNIDKDLSDISILKTIETKTGIKPSHLFLGVSFLVLFLALADIFADILTTLFGMIYPAYMSWKAIEKKNEEQKKIWLTYWIVFGSLSTIDDSLSFILHLIPGFFAFRFIIYLWMFYPRANNGANIVYVAIKPLMEKLRAKIDELKASAKKSA